MRVRKTNKFSKITLHGYIITLIFAVLSSDFLPILTSADLSDISFLISIVLYWIFFIYAFLTGIVLFFVRKLKPEKYLRFVSGIAVVVFGTGFCIGHCIIARAVAEAIDIGMMATH